MFYEPTEYEQQLLSSDVFDLGNLNLLERKSLTRLQFVLIGKQNFIKSNPDQYQQLRIIVLALFIKIFSQKTQQNQRRLNLIKQIVYQSTLSSLTKEKGLEIGQLHKAIAVQLSKLAVSFGTESYLINIFNCVHFFDQILLRSISQKFSPSLGQLDLQTVYAWIQEVLSFKLIFNSENIMNQGDGQIYLKKSNNGILRESALNMTYVESSGDDYSVNNSSRGSKNSGSGSNPRRPKSKIQILQSISVGDSLSPLPFDKENNSRQKQLNKLLDNGQVSGFIEKSFPRALRQSQRYSTDSNGTHRIIRTKKNQTSWIWNILCCKESSAHRIVSKKMF